MRTRDKRPEFNSLNYPDIPELNDYYNIVSFLCFLRSPNWDRTYLQPNATGPREQPRL